MEEKTSTLNIRQTGTYQSEVSVPETGAIKTAVTLDSALTLTLLDIVKHPTTRFLILVYADQQGDKDGRSVNPQSCPQTDLKHQAAFKVAQLGIVPQVKKRKPHLMFEVTRPLTREQATGLCEYAGKLFDRYYTKDKREVQLDAVLEKARAKRKAAAHE